MLQRRGLVVSYAGVSFAWGSVLDFCVARRGELELTAAVSGRGISLSDDLRRRFTTEGNMGTGRVVLEMKLFYDGNGWPGMYACTTGCLSFGANLHCKPKMLDCLHHLIDFQVKNRHLALHMIVF